MGAALRARPTGRESDGSASSAAIAATAAHSDGGTASSSSSSSGSRNRSGNRRPVTARRVGRAALSLLLCSMPPACCQEGAALPELSLDSAGVGGSYDAVSSRRLRPLSASLMTKATMRLAHPEGSLSRYGEILDDITHSRWLDSRASSHQRHNGTHLVRIVNATWDCVFREGGCYGNKAPMEEMGEQLATCMKQHNEGPLSIVMEIDMECAGLKDVVDCSAGNVRFNDFDPFKDCNNNALLLTARCRPECRQGKAKGEHRKPWHVCVFNFDSSGVYNMSDETVETCVLESQCKSPYVEVHEMFCSGHMISKDYKPSWLSSQDPWQHRASHSLKRPAVRQQSAGAQPPQDPPMSFLSQLLWICAIALVFVLGVKCAASACPEVDRGLQLICAVALEARDYLLGRPADHARCSHIASCYQPPPVEFREFSDDRQGGGGLGL
eukprot:TRINITY_DN20084_c0_g3_i1.p1 TRINITY_DN20084_c0_g3~~TRINITY_DN20084_c0_g3_i1.p1  ORF type:complete len:440 (-),score=74.88 TRINITY_DN20084_c0_g3_i1:157-1476(-)